MPDFARIVLKLYLLFFWFSNHIQGFQYKPVDVSLQIVKLSEGLSER
jgi:hypothetical protein